MSKIFFECAQCGAYEEVPESMCCNSCCKDVDEEIKKAKDQARSLLAERDELRILRDQWATRAMDAEVIGHAAGLREAAGVCEAYIKGETGRIARYRSVAQGVRECHARILALLGPVEGVR